MSNNNKLWRSMSLSGTSLANEELVKKENFPTPQDKPLFNTISFLPEAKCMVDINDGEEILEVRPILGLERNGRFRPIYSFKIIDGGIPYYALVGY